MAINPYQAAGYGNNQIADPNDPFRSTSFGGAYKYTNPTTHVSSQANYGVFSPYGFPNQSYSSSGLARMGWYPGMPAPQVPYDKEGNPSTYLGWSPDGSGEGQYLTQNMANAMYKNYQDTHNPIADAALAEYQKSFGMNNPGGIIPPGNPPEDPWGTLNSMGMQNPSANSAAWQPITEFWQPNKGDPNQGNTSFGKWWGTGDFAAGNGPGGWSRSNMQPVEGNPNAVKSPWGQWDNGGASWYG